MWPTSSRFCCRLYAETCNLSPVFRNPMSGGPTFDRKDAMIESLLCPRCGQQFPADAPAGLCPTCLLQEGRDSNQCGSSSELTVVISGFVPPEPADLQPHFPQLEVLALLGKGGMGAVYKARQKQLGRLVAVKILPPEVGRDPAFAERFSREARALAQLHHQYIVGIYAFGQTGDLYS